jgi:hypothetical protein
VTREDIEKIEPGRELDALVAGKVMGFKIEQTNSETCTIWDGSEVRYFEPSTDISAAWEIVEKFGEMLVRRRLGGTDYRAWIQTDLYGKCEVYAHGKTAPEAICKAALYAVMNL